MPRVGGVLVDPVAVLPREHGDDREQDSEHQRGPDQALVADDHQRGDAEAVFVVLLLF